ncbi:MAG: cytochrome c3 family protein [Desulfurivibrionaceae bacterium]
MRTGKRLVYIFLAAAAMLLSCVIVQAGSIGMPKEPIVIGIANPVRFDHGLHRSLEVPCGECHHDNKHNPRRDEEIYAVSDGRELRCQNCHNQDFANTFLRRREDIFHTNCRPCHAVGVKGKRGPRKCNDCHFKNGGA